MFSTLHPADVTTVLSEIDSDPVVALNSIVHTTCDKFIDIKFSKKIHKEVDHVVE